MHSSQIRKWKNSLAEGANGIFGSDHDQKKKDDASLVARLYQPKGISGEDLTLMKSIGRQYLATPFYGARKIAAWLKSQD